MAFKITIMMFFFFFVLMGCGSQFTCGYHPEKFKLVESFSINSSDTNIEAEHIARKFEKFGIENGYCIANGSMDKSVVDEFFINLRIVKNDISFYVRGDDRYIFWFELKDTISGYDNEKIEFCNFIKTITDTDKIEYSKKGKLCNFN